jgi:MoaA/NifB/PqqE/SkfB family radical SAM enzyme
MPSTGELQTRVPDGTAAPSGRSDDGRVTALLGWAVRSLPLDARILLYPGGRNARLAVMDLAEQAGLGDRIIVGYADDSPPPDASDCRTLGEAVAKWHPTHVLTCAREPALERTLAANVQRRHPDLPVISARAMFVDALADVDNRRERSLRDIKSITLVMCKTCNLRCSFCYQTDFTQRMDSVIFNEKLRPVYPHAEVIKLVGGEVTAFRHALPFVREIPRLYPRVRLRLTTNGILFDERWTDVFCATGGSVHNSIVAATPRTYERVTGQDKHGQVMENIRRTIHTRERQRSPLGVYVGMVITPETQHEIEALVNLGAELGVDGIEIGVDTMRMCALDRGLIEAQVRRITERDRVPVIWDRLSMLYPDLCAEPAVTEACELPDRAVFVEVNGTVYACCHSHVAIGSLRQDTIETIFSSAAARAVAADVRTGRCASCPRDCIYRPPTVARGDRNAHH